jgi:hypothetical protein
MVARFDPRYTRPNRVYNTRSLVPKRHWHATGHITGYKVPIGVANSGSGKFNPDFSRLWFVQFDFFHFDRLTWCIKYRSSGFHAALLSFEVKCLINRQLFKI